MNVFAILLTLLAAGFTIVSFMESGMLGDPITDAVLWLVAAMSWNQADKHLFAAVTAAIGAILLTVHITETGFMAPITVAALAIWGMAIWSGMKAFNK